MESIDSSTVGSSKKILASSSTPSSSPLQLNVSTPDPLMAAAVEPEFSPAKSKKYDILFCKLDCSIRILRMRGSTTTFTKISDLIERLTDNKFTHSHLAQLKFILPEAIEIKKILIHDKDTCCMKPDLHISLHVQAVQSDGNFKSESGNVELRKVFLTRLLDFFKAHPEGYEIPEEALPEPFNLLKKTHLSIASDSSAVGHTPTVSSLDQQPPAASHFAQSFTRRFSQKSYGVENGQERIVSFDASVLPVSNPQIKSFIPASSIPVTRSNVEPSSNKACLTGMPTSQPPATPVKDVYSYNGVDCSSKETRGSPASTPAKLMAQPPKRCYVSPDDDLTQPESKLIRRPSRSRCLKFDTPVKSAKVEDYVQKSACSAVDNDVLDILQENLIQSIKEKEGKASVERDPAISQAKRRHQMLASLPKLFDKILFFFQSFRRSVIRKEDLVLEMIRQVKITDGREVEEQLRLLQELVPKWIYEKSSSSGDILLCVNKMISPETVRNRLAEAK